jgi:cyclopropane fatty-acyl-phospholipid synthase-like methyltransferase
VSHERIAATFDQWADDGRDLRMEKGHGDVVRQVIAQLGVRPGEQILDLGCGNGWATRLLAKTAPGVGAVGRGRRAEDDRARRGIAQPDDPCAL